MIKIQKIDVKFYNHLKGSDSETFHNREMNLEKSPLSKLVLGHKHTPQSPRTATQLDPIKS